MDFNEYQKKAMRTKPEYEKRSEQIDNAIYGLVGETGEVTDLIKKAFFQGHTLDFKEVAKELGDLQWYLALMADAIGYNLEEIAEMNVEKLEKRYPNKCFEADKSVNREE